MRAMLFRRRLNGQVTYSKGFKTLEEAERVAAQFRANDMQWPPAQPMETVVEVIGDGIAVQLDAVNSGPTSRFASELTPEGEQTVIPGCERNAAPGKRQLDLF